jgi:hypothetical protein
LGRGWTDDELREQRALRDSINAAFAVAEKPT